MELTIAHLRYLLVLYQLAQNSMEIKSQSVAQALGVSKPAVKCMLDELMRRGLLVKERYGRVYLTDRGHFVARHFAANVNCVLENFPPLGLDLTDSERSAAAQALVAALPERCFARQYQVVFGPEAEKETEA